MFLLQDKQARSPETIYSNGYSCSLKVSFAM
jgi:hypothetical protein